MTSTISSRGYLPPLPQSRARLPLRRASLASTISCREFARFSGSRWQPERQTPRQGCDLDKTLVHSRRRGERTSSSCSSDLLQQIRSKSATSATRGCCAARSKSSASAAPDDLATLQTILNCSWIWSTVTYVALLTSGKQASWSA